MTHCPRLGRSLAPATERSSPTNRDIRQRMRLEMRDGAGDNVRALHGTCPGDAQMRAQSESANAPADFAMVLYAPHRVHDRARATSPWWEPPFGKAYRRPALQKPR